MATSSPAVAWSGDPSPCSPEVRGPQCPVADLDAELRPVARRDQSVEDQLRGLVPGCAAEPERQRHVEAVDDDVADRPDPSAARLLECGKAVAAQVVEQGDGRQRGVAFGDPVGHHLEVEAVGSELRTEALRVVPRRHREVRDDVPNGPSLAQ